MMEVIGYQQSLPISDELSLQYISLLIFQISGRDSLVEVHVASVNPVGIKVCKRCVKELKLLRSTDRGNEKFSA